MPLPDTEKFNMEFAQFIETLPVLYDYNLKEYSNRNEQDRAWRIVASKFDATGQECKMKWKNMRGGLTRYLKQKQSLNSSVKKQYYLWDVMQFVLPYTKTRTPGETYHLQERMEEQEIVEAIITEPTDIVNGEEDTFAVEEPQQYEVQATCEPGPSPSNTSVPPTPSAPRVVVHSQEKNDRLEVVVTQYLSQQNNSLRRQIEENPDLNFLKSLLPDLSTLPSPAKRKFKRKVLEIIDDLVEEYSAVPTNTIKILTE